MRPGRRFIPFLLVILLPGCTSAAHPSRSDPSKVVINALTFPDLPETQYVLGLAKHFDFLPNLQIACQEWTALPEAQKRGLAFVDPHVVPSCADPSYVSNAAQLHTQRYTYAANKPEYFDMGAPRPPLSHNPKDYNCADVKQMVSQNFGPHPYPRPIVSWDVTAGEKQALAEWQAYYGQISPIYRMYEDGGNFPEGCYPPAAALGTDYSFSFYPNEPVRDIREAATRVFAGAGNDCNVCGMGAPYTVKDGDTLGDISTCFYGNPSIWELIAATNRIKDETAVPTGRIIHLPGVTDASQCVKPYS